MKLQINLRIYIPIITILISLESISAQDINTTYKYAVNLLEEENYKDAIPVLRRVAFFANGNYRDTYLLLGDSYRKNKEYEKALNYYKLAYDSYQNDSSKLAVQLKIIHLHLKNSEPNFALSSLYSLDTPRNDTITSIVEFYTSSVFFQKTNFEESKKLFLLSINTEDSLFVKEIEKLYSKAERNNRKNPKVPMFLSIIPGVGQLYLKEYKAAGNSLFITTGFSVLYFFAFKNLPPLDAAFTVLPWLNRYYSGGMLQAKRLAISKKQYNHILFYNELINEYQKYAYKTNKILN